jgi:hypothetical protein
LRRERGEEREVLARGEAAQQHRAMADVERWTARNAPAAVCERRKAGEGTQQCGLARAVRPAQEREPRHELERDPSKDGAVVQDDRDIVERCVVRE